MIVSTIIIVCWATLWIKPGAQAKEELSHSQASGVRLPKYLGKTPLAERLTHDGDLAGNIDAGLRLAATNWNHILALSNCLIDKQEDYDYRGMAAEEPGRFGHRLGLPALLAVLRDETHNT